VRLEGARGRRWSDGRRRHGAASTVGGRWATGGVEGGGLPDLDTEEAGGGETNPTRRRWRPCGGVARSDDCATGRALGDPSRFHSLLVTL
jgi:hypothetical protein